MLELWKIALGALRANWFRAVLTAFGVVIGVASLVAVGAVSAGAQKQVGDSIRRLGANVVLVDGEFITAGAVQTLSDRTLTPEDAAYFSEPFTEPSRGREAIIHNWLERQDPPGSTTFMWTTLQASDELAFVQGETVYPHERYSNLWVIRFAPFAPSADAATPQATEFTEWWMDQSKPSGG